MLALCDSMVILSQIHELAEKESEDGVFKMLRSDVAQVFNNYSHWHDVLFYSLLL